MINLISYQFDVLYESSQFFFSLFFFVFFPLGWIRVGRLQLTE